MRKTTIHPEGRWYAKNEKYDTIRCNAMHGSREGCWALPPSKFRLGQRWQLSPVADMIRF